MLVELLSSEYVRGMLSPEMASELSKYLIMLAFIWGTMLRRVSGHFKSIEKSLEKVVTELASFKAVVAKDLELGDKRMTAMEDEVETLKKLPERVKFLEAKIN